MKKDHTVLIIITAALLTGILMISLFLFVRWQVKDATDSEAKKNASIISVIATGYEQLRKDYEVKTNTTIPSAEALVTSVVGEQGIQGFPGEAGLPGLQGLQGIPGLPGAQGFQGASGTAGAQGAQGNQGVQGSTGETGTAGQAGVSGPQGDQGPTGPQGPQGPEGPAGAECSPGYHKEVIVWPFPPITTEECVQDP